MDRPYVIMPAVSVDAGFKVISDGVLKHLDGTVGWAVEDEGWGALGSFQNLFLIAIPLLFSQVFVLTKTLF